MTTNRATTLHGCPVSNLTASLSVGNRGNLLFQDTNLIEHLAQFDRERIPERVVHAKGAAAFGYFEVTHDITALCKAKVFNAIGKQTPVALRFSTVGGESGSADTARDPRGFAVKLYTEDGNWDIVGNNTPIFFLRDPILFPSFIHSQKRDPGNHLKVADRAWDMISLRPETTHQVTFLYSDRGTPDGFRYLNGYGSHTFKLVNTQNNAVYCKFHWKTDQGIRNLTAEEAARLAGEDPDYAIRDLYTAIDEGRFPSWSLYVQIMTFDEASSFRFNPFDVTKVWPHAEFPLRPVGRMVLNRNPANYFAEVEQLAFAPANMVPGIEASPDKMLQGRLFSYTDTQRHRLGGNFPQLPVNRPLQPLKSYTRAGPMSYDNQENAPDYFPNSFGGPTVDDFATQSVFPVTGDAVRFDSGSEDNFTQVDTFWTSVLTMAERQRLVNNIAGSLINASTVIQTRAIGNFAQVNTEFGAMLIEAIGNLSKTRVPEKKFATPTATS